MHHGLRRTFNAAVVFQQPTGQPNQSARGHNLGYIVESALPTDKARLVFLAQFGHVNAVCCDVVGGSAKRDNGHQGYTHGEIVGQL